MRWRFILNVFGVLNFFFGLTMLFPLLCGMFYKDASVYPLLESMGLTVGGGALLYLFLCRPLRGTRMQRDDRRYRLFEKTAAKQCWGDPNNPTRRATTRGNSIFLFICSSK